MSLFTGGVIPTINVSNNTLVNNAVTGVAGNLAYNGVSVALSPLLGAQLSNQLGLDPNASLGNLGNIISQGAISTGGQYLNQIVSQQITNSKALGPFGPLVGGLTQSATNVLTQGVSGLLAGRGFTGFGFGGRGTRETASDPNNVPSRAFPGAGDEPYGDKDANYGGYVYNLGNGGKDVQFSLKLATPAAMQNAQSEVASPSVPPTAGLNETFPNNLLSGYNINFKNLVSTEIASGFSGLSTSPDAWATTLGTSVNLAGIGGMGSTFLG